MLETLFAINIAIIIYFVILALYYTILLVATFPDLIHHYKENEYGNLAHIMERSHPLPVTVIMPAFNEEKRIINSLESIFRNSYKNIEVIVVSDGSTDNTVGLLVNHYNMYEQPAVIYKKIPSSDIYHYYKSKTHPLTVIDKAHKNGPDSINVGLNACRTPLFATIDADTVLEPDAFTQLIFSFLANPSSIIVSGSVYVINDNKVENGQFIESHKLPDAIIPGMQATEYLRSFLYFRCGWNPMGGNLCYPGAFTLFEKQAVVDAGGFDEGNFAYDAEITMKIHHYMRKNKFPYTAYFTPAAFAWTEVPKTLKHYWRQRNFWQRGLLRSGLRHMGMCFNPRYGITGLLNFPTFFAFEIMGGLVEFTAYITFPLAYYLGEINLHNTVIFILLAWFYMAFLTVACILISTITFNRYNHIRDIWRIMGLSFLELVGFRQFRVLSQAIATVQYFINRLRGKPV